MIRAASFPNNFPRNPYASFPDSVSYFRWTVAQLQ